MKWINMQNTEHYLEMFLTPQWKLILELQACMYIKGIWKETKEQ